MKNIVSFTLILMLLVPFLFGCKSRNNQQEEEYVVDKIWYIDSVHIHPSGISYTEGDTRHDRIMKFHVDNQGRVAQYDEITDTSLVLCFFDYTYFPDSIIKRTQVDTVMIDEWYSVYELNEELCIQRLVQHFFDVEIVTEYRYDMENHLCAINFCSHGEHCKWLWRGGNLEAIVWGDASHITRFRYDEDREIPFESCFVELPKLDIALSMMGFYGQQPRNACIIETEEVSGELVDIGFNRYITDAERYICRQVCYKGIDTDSIDYSLTWSSVEIRSKK